MPLIAFGADRWILSADGGNTVTLWDIKSPSPDGQPKVLRGHSGVITTLTITPDGRWAITGGKDKNVYLWDLGLGDPAVDPVILPHGGEIITCVVSPDSRWLVTGSSDKKLQVWPTPGTRQRTSAIVLDGHDRACLQHCHQPGQPLDVDRRA